MKPLEIRKHICYAAGLTDENYRHVGKWLRKKSYAWRIEFWDTSITEEQANSIGWALKNLGMSQIKISDGEGWSDGKKSWYVVIEFHDMFPIPPFEINLKTS